MPYRGLRYGTKYIFADRRGRREPPSEREMGAGREGTAYCPLLNRVVLYFLFSFERSFCFWSLSSTDSRPNDELRGRTVGRNARTLIKVSRVAKENGLCRVTLVLL